jgi:hypothetical protein
MHGVEQLVGPERGTACFSNLFVRSLLEWCSPAPGQLDQKGDPLDAAE